MRVFWNQDIVVVVDGGGAESGEAVEVAEMGLKRRERGKWIRLLKIGGKKQRRKRERKRRVCVALVG